MRIGAEWRSTSAALHRTGQNPARTMFWQRTSYLAVIFILFPLVIWTGLALSPGFNAAFPWGVNLLGGRQSARTLHFLVSGALVFFLLVHVAMVAWSGFGSRMRAMIVRAGYD